MVVNRTGLAAALALTVLWTSEHCAAQCLQWSTSFPTGGNFYALTVFDDGAGPALFAGGEGYVRAWNGTGWTVVDGLDDAVQAFAVYDDGTGSALYAGGWFTSRIRKWTGGSTWTPVGNGVSNAVFTLRVHDDGFGTALFVGGGFTSAGTLPCGRIARWNGASWQSLNGGVAGGSSGAPVVNAMAVFDDGSGPALYAGGNFTSAGGIPANYVAKWDGTSWSALGLGVDGWVYSMAAYDDGSGAQLYVTGPFTSAGGLAIPRYARWDGSAWSAFAGSATGAGRSMVVFDDGNGPGLYVGCGGAAVGGMSLRDVGRWDASGWSTLGYGVNSTVHALAVYDDGLGGGPDLYLGGLFAQAGAIASVGIAQWKGCAGPINPMCFGDGTVAPCPCSNQGITGHGCQNSASTGGARLFSTGSITPDTLVLTSSGELPSALTIFIQGSALNPDTVPFGDGLRCVGGSLTRLYVKSASSGTAQAPQAGDPSITQQSANLGDLISPGMIRYYQAYYRDPSTSYCAAPTGSTFNASNGLRVVW